MAVKKLRKARNANYNDKRTFEVELADMFKRYDTEQNLSDLLDVILGIEDSVTRSRLFGIEGKGV